VRVGKGGGSAPAAAAPERVGPPASQYVAGAARGEAEALYQLGVCYDTGKGVPQSYDRAAGLYQQTAAKGHAGAQLNLGVRYYKGQGVPQSYERAAELYTQAAAQGHSYAQASLGNLYYNGLGVPRDDARAVALFKQAAAGGNKTAGAGRGRAAGGACLMRQGHPCPWTDIARIPASPVLCCRVPTRPQPLRLPQQGAHDGPLLRPPGELRAQPAAGGGGSAPLPARPFMSFPH